MTQTAKLTTSDGEANDWFGDGASINGDIIVAGAEGDDYWRGSVYVFIKPGSGWANMTQTAKLTASDGAGGDRLGVSARISDDTIVAGAVYDDSDRGSAYVFVKPVGGWSNMTQTAKLTPLDSAPSSYYFGGSVDISGGTVVVGANGVSNYTGAAYVFVKPAAGWSNMTQTAKLTASDGGEYYAFGSSVSISGNLVVVGADGGNSYKGAVYTFVKPTAGWSNMTQTDLLVASDGAEGDGFGLATATNGSDILAGTYAHNSYRGAMYMFSGGATAVQLSQLRGYAANETLPVGMGIILLLGIGLLMLRMGVFQQAKR
jgi:formylmethanofuran dehydrogenase subunit D